MICRLCGDAGAHIPLSVREMMFGTRERFDYFDCGHCGTVQIVDIPDDLDRHYPGSYYSYAAPESGWLAAQRDRRWTTRLGARRSYRILDVGCGNGALLDSLARAGFTSLRGVDPFLPTDTQTPRGVPLTASYLSDIDGRYDLVMFNHSLEHMPDPIAALTQAKELLTPGGTVLVRVPTPSSEAYRRYGVDWVQLDAPRHLVIPSRWGMSIAAFSAGLRLVRIMDDSGEFQFSASECYRRDIPLADPRGRELFSQRQLWAWKRQARRLNKTGMGDQAVFVLRAQNK